jgi:hypothetical protein
MTIFGYVAPQISPTKHLRTCDLSVMSSSLAIHSNGFFFFFFFTYTKHILLCTLLVDQTLIFITNLIFQMVLKKQSKLSLQCSQALKNHHNVVLKQATTILMLETMHLWGLL